MRLRSACLAALALAGCNAVTTAPAPRAAAPAGYASEAYTPPGFSLPGGGGCQGDIARFRALMANDYATGNVALPVYRRIEAELGQAERVCAAGDGARAGAMLRSTKARFGYPAS
jgi:hypothetical protein